MLVAWSGTDIEEEEEESEAVQAARFDRLSSAHTKHITDGPDEQAVKELRAALQSMRAALTRTQPTQRSCEVRLALADWLHRRLRRAKLHTNDEFSRPDFPKALLIRYRASCAAFAAYCGSS